MSRAFILAVALHVAAALLLVLAIRYWPVAARRPSPAPLELDMAASPAPAPAAVVPPVMDQVMAAVPSERRFLAMPASPIPEVRPAVIPEPVSLVSAFRPENQSETIQIPRGDVRAMAAGILPSRPPPAPALDKGGGPTALAEIKPHYPEAARTRGEAGSVTIRLRVSRQGEADFAEVKSSSGFPSLDDSALSAAKAARFKPAEVDGQPVPAELDLRFEFRLQE
jgi:protein TonB